jgi:hypothetical protein
MNARSAHIPVIVGGICMLAGALDPMEGSPVILLGSGLFALGTFLEHAERRLITYRVLVFALIAIGVAALWGLGGLGGSSGRSMWWGLLILPYLIGWSMGVWGRASPRWMLWLGIVVGVWYLTIFLNVAGRNAGMPQAPVLVLAGVGVLTILGCVSRLRHAA